MSIVLERHQAGHGADAFDQAIDSYQSGRPGVGRANYPEASDLEPERYWEYTEGLWSEQDGALQPIHNMWAQNLLFLASLQWWERNSVSGRWEHRKGPDYRRWPVTNLVLPYYLHFLAKATKQRPAWIAVPASNDPSDLAAARLAEKALEQKWVELRMARKLRRAVAWCIVTGNAYLYPYWAENTGELEPHMVEEEVGVYDEETGELVGTAVIDVPADRHGRPLMDRFGRYAVDSEPERIDSGDIAVKVLSPFRIRVNPDAVDDDEVKKFIIAESVPVRELQRDFPQHADQFSSSSGFNLERYEHLFSGVSSHASGADTQVTAGWQDMAQEVEECVIFHYHEGPSSRYPDGRYWAVTENVLLQTPGALPDGLWPGLIHLRDVEMPGRYLGSPKLEAVVGLNREYNEVNQHILEHHQLLLRGKWLVPIGSQIGRGRITNEPGEVIQHTPGLPPKQADIKPLPAPVYQERERIKGDFQLVTSMNRVSMGDAPSGITSGRAFLVLQEADDTDMGPFLEQLESGVAELAWHFIQLMQRRYTDDRFIRIVGDDRRYQIEAFRGSDLEGVADVVPQAGSSFPWSQSARQSALIDLMNAVPDLFLDPETGQLDRERISRELPFAGMSTAMGDADVDHNEVEREHDLFANWTPDEQLPVPKPEPWQNLPFHIRAHKRLLKTTETESWHPVARELFIQHVMQSEMMMAEETDAQREQQLQDIQDEQTARSAGQAAVQGPPAGPGGPRGAPGGPAVDPNLSPREQAIQAEEMAVDAAADAIARGDDPTGP